MQQIWSQQVGRRQLVEIHLIGYDTIDVYSSSAKASSLPYIQRITDG